MTFDVIDPKTGEYPDLEKIARTEEWAQNLIYCDMDGFCINEDGNLILMDECGNYAYCPEDRFEVHFNLPVFEKGQKPMKDKHCCGNCEYGSYDKMQGYVCVNGDSEYCADFVEYDHTCEDWEEKKDA